MRRFITTLMISAFIASPLSVYADDAMMEKILSEIQGLKNRVSQLENKVGSQSHLIATQAKTIQQYEDRFEGIDNLSDSPTDSSLNISASLSTVVQSTTNANADALSGQGKDDVTDASYSLSIGLQKDFGDYGSAYIKLSSGNNNGVEGEIKAFKNVNGKSSSDENVVSVSVAWYETRVLDWAKTTFTFGRIDPIVYIAGNDYNSSSNHFFGDFFKEDAIIEASSKTAGMRMGIDATDYLEIQVVATDGDADAEDIFDTPYFATQLNFMPKFFDRPGNYRFFVWHNAAPHTKWNDAVSTENAGYGGGISFDQEITDTISAFARYSQKDPSVFLAGDSFSLISAWSVGSLLYGATWGREDDHVGLAFGQAIPSKDYKAAGTNLEASPESHFEIFYNLKINEHLSLTPDFQAIIEPFGGDAANGDKTILVGGVRGQIDF